MTYSKVYAAKQYTEDGTIKKRYYHVGNIKHTDRFSFLNLSMFPNTDFYVFDGEAPEA